MATARAPAARRSEGYVGRGQAARERLVDVGTLADREIVRRCDGRTL